MIRYYLYEGGTLMIATTIEKPKGHTAVVQQWVTDELHLSQHRFPVMPDLEARLSMKGYKDWDEIPLSEFAFVAMTTAAAIEMTEC